MVGNLSLKILICNEKKWPQSNFLACVTPSGPLFQSYQLLCSPPWPHELRVILFFSLSSFFLPSFLCCYCSLFSEILGWLWTCCVAKADLGLLILFPPFPKSWDYGCVLPCLAILFFFCGYSIVCYHISIGLFPAYRNLEVISSLILLSLPQVQDERISAGTEFSRVDGHPLYVMGIRFFRQESPQILPQRLCLYSWLLRELLSHEKM